MKKQKKLMTNLELFELGISYPKLFKDMSEIKMPVKTLFYLQSNLNTILDKSKELDMMRHIVVKKYGKKDKDGKYSVPKELIDEANSELTDLLGESQEVELYVLPLSYFEGVSLSTVQVSSLLIMIEEDKEKEDKDNEEE